MKTIIVNFLLQLLFYTLLPLEWILTSLFYNKDILQKHPPIFIIGAPRTGSTLFYQWVTSYWNIAYLTNFNCLFYKIPILSFIVSNLFLRSMDFSHIDSNYGHLNGVFSPSECGAFWYNWFPRGSSFVPEGKISSKNKKKIRVIVSILSQISGKTIIFKNLNCGQRIGALSEIFPEALFVYCKRESVYVAQSVLLARERVNGDRTMWWSIIPKEFEQIKTKEPLRQIVEQIYFIEKQIKEDINKYYPSNFYIIKYEDMVNAPAKELQLILTFFKDKNIIIRQKKSYENTILQSTNTLKLNKNEFTILERYVKEIYK